MPPNCCFCTTNSLKPKQTSFPAESNNRSHIIQRVEDVLDTLLKKKCDSQQL